MRTAPGFDASKHTHTDTQTGRTTTVYTPDYLTLEARRITEQMQKTGQLARGPHAVRWALEITNNGARLIVRAFRRGELVLSTSEVL